MSRLAETLTGMDQKASRALRLGEVPNLAARKEPSRRRRVIGPAVIVALVAAVGTAFMVRPPGGGAPVTPTRGSAIESTPAPIPRPVEAEAPAAVLIRQGFEASRLGAVGEAAQLFRRALELNPVDPDGWNNLGVGLVRQGDLAGGLEAFRRALRLKPAHAQANRNLAVALDRQGKSREAAGYYHSFLALSGEGHPDRAEVRRRLGESGSRAGE